MCHAIAKADKGRESGSGTAAVVAAPGKLISFDINNRSGEMLVST